MIIKKKIQRVPRSPHISSGIRPEGGASANQEVLTSDEFYPDRTLTPLVLQPYLSYTDATTGKTVENALPELIDGNWYRLTDTNRSLGICEATKISMAQTGTDANGDVITVFSVVSTPGASNYGRLTVRENVPVGTEITYIFEATLATDGRPVREYFTTRCDAVMEIPDIEFDNNSTALYNPLDDPQYFSINPSLTIDYPVVWKWMSYHELENGWVELGTTQLDWCIDKVGDGIKIDRKRMPDGILLRCIADVTIDGSVVQLEKVVSHTRMLPHFEINITHVGEMTEDVDAFCPFAEIKYGQRLITDDSELLVRWLNSSGTVVGTGINPTIKISALGADGGYQLEVLDRGGFAAIVDNGYLIVDNGVLVITRSKI